MGIGVTGAALACLLLGAPAALAGDRAEGDKAMQRATKTHEAEYYLPHLAHAPMEPPVALANVTADSYEIWAPVQSPFACRNHVAGALGLDPSLLSTRAISSNTLGGSRWCRTELARTTSRDPSAKGV